MSNEKKTMFTRWSAQQQRWAIIDNSDDPDSPASILLPQAASTSVAIELLRNRMTSNPTWQKYACRNSENLSAIISTHPPKTKTSYREAGCLPEILSNASSFTTLLLATGVLTFIIQKMAAPSQISIGQLSACFFRNNLTQGNTFPITNTSLSIMAECLNSNNNSSIDLTSGLRTGLLVVIVFTAVLSFAMNVVKRLAVDNEKQEKEAYQLMLGVMKNLRAIQEEIESKEKVGSFLNDLFQLNDLAQNQTILRNAIYKAIDKISKIDFYIKISDAFPLIGELFRQCEAQTSNVFYEKFQEYLKAEALIRPSGIKNILTEIINADLRLAAEDYMGVFQVNSVFIPLADSAKITEMTDFLFDTLFQTLKNNKDLEDAVSRSVSNRSENNAVLFNL